MCAKPRANPGAVLYVARVVAAGGDEIRLRKGKVIRNDTRERTDGPQACEGKRCNFLEPITVPAGHLFLLGDNRSDSFDSRFWGPVPEEWVVGRYWFGL